MASPKKSAKKTKGKGLPAPVAAPIALFHYLNPKAVLSAKAETLMRVEVLSRAIGGYGLSGRTYKELPKDLKALFESVACPQNTYDASSRLL